MDKLIVGVFITMIIIFVAGLAYFAIRPDPTVYTFGNPNIDDPTLNPYYIDPDYKYPLGYVCQTDDQCDDNLLCDTSIMRCRYKDYTQCNDASNCLTTSFCNSICLPASTPVGINQPTDKIFGSSVPCPDGYQSFSGPAGDLIPIAPDTSINICKYAPGYPCNSNDDCASSGCANINGDICDTNCGKGGGWCINKARNGEPCTNGNTCSSGFCYKGSNGNYCQDPNLNNTDNETLGMVCSINNKPGMQCGDSNRCFGGICATPSSSLLQGCSYLRTCPGTMNCYNIPYNTYDEDGNLESLAGGIFELCTEDDINCICTYTMDTSNNTDIPPSGSDKPNPKGLFGNLIPNKILGDQVCIKGMKPDSTNSNCVSDSGPAKDKGTLCYNNNKVNTNGPYLYLLSVSLSEDSSTQQQYYPINGIINAVNFEYIQIPYRYQGSPVTETIVGIKGVTIPVDNNNIASGTNEIVYLIGEQGSLYECRLIFKKNGNQDNTVTNPSFSENYSGEPYTVVSPSKDFIITKIKLDSPTPDTIQYFVKDVIAIYKVGNSTEPPSTSIYVLLNVKDATDPTNTYYYQSCKKITRSISDGNYTIDDAFNINNNKSSESEGYIYSYMTGYNHWRKTPDDKSYTVVDKKGIYILFSSKDNQKAIYYTLLTGDTSWSSGSPTNYQKNEGVRPNLTLLFESVEEQTGKSDTEWNYYVYVAYGIPNTTSRIKYYALKEDVTSKLNSIPNYLEFDDTSTKYQSYYFDVVEYFYVDTNNDNTYTSYINGVGLASYTKTSIGGDINLYYYSGSVLTAIPGTFSSKTQLSLSPNELYILTDYSCTPSSS